MKLGKLSLAAVLAVSAFATMASAKPFGDAIKNVDLSGYARMRYTSTHTSATAPQNTNNSWEFKSQLNINAAIDDNFFTYVGFQYLGTNYAHNSVPTVASATNNNYNFDGSDNQFSIYNAYLGYKSGNSSVTVGRQTVGAFVTDDLYGDGLKVTVGDIPGLTLVGSYFNTLHNDTDIEMTSTDAGNRPAYQHSMYNAGAIGSYDPFSFQVWYSTVRGVGDFYSLEAALNFNFSDNVTFGLTGQYGHSVLKYGNYKNGNLYAAQINLGAYGFDSSAGYVNFSTGKGEMSAVSFEDKGSFISAGEQIANDYQNFSGKNQLWFFTAGYTFFNKVRIGADIASLKSSNLDPSFDYADSKWNQGSFEYVLRASYQYNDNLAFQTYYSQLNNYGDNKDNKVRFEAKYSF